jgi:hypothetical protein
MSSSSRVFVLVKSLRLLSVAVVLSLLHQAVITCPHWVFLPKVGVDLPTCTVNAHTIYTSKRKTSNVRIQTDLVRLGCAFLICPCLLSSPLSVPSRAS